MEFERDLPEFGEVMMHSNFHSFGKDNEDSRWEQSGIFMGLRFESADIIVTIREGVDKVHTVQEENRIRKLECRNTR